MNTEQKVGLILLIFCLIMWFLIIPAEVAGWRASIYPRIGVLWTAISAVLLIISSRKDTSKRISFGLKELTRVAIITIILFVYFFMIDFLGFYIASILVLIVVMFIFGVEDWRILILLPIILVLFLYFLLEKLLRAPLPKQGIF